MIIKGGTTKNDKSPLISGLLIRGQHYSFFLDGETFYYLFVVRLKQF